MRWPILHQKLKAPYLEGVFHVEERLSDRGDRIIHHGRFQSTTVAIHRNGIWTLVNGSQAQRHHVRQTLKSVNGPGSVS